MYISLGVVMVTHLSHLPGSVGRGSDLVVSWYANEQLMMANTS